MLALEMDTRRVRSFDGTQVEYQVSEGQGPWLVLVNGLGAGLAAWNHQINYLRDHVRFLTWDYRGLRAGPDDEPVAMPGPPVEVHAKDMAAVLAAENVQGGVWMGWSMGAQVMLEAFRSGPARPDDLVLINPCYGRRPAHRGAFRRLYPHALGLLDRNPSVLERLLRRSASWPETVSWLKRFGVVGSTIDEDALAEVVAHFGSVDAAAYITSLRATSSHRVDGILGAIDVPTLVILGEKDVVTPRAIAEPLARQIPNAELFVIRGATHFALLEYPELMNLRVEKFLREHDI
jgi:pimeloyl-ACP methyl ester carboxylesterase